MKGFVVNQNEQQSASDGQGAPHFTVDVQPASTTWQASPSHQIWTDYAFAPEWFADAIAEAHHRRDPHARRREILFAVCFAESYLFEWVRDEVLKRDFSKLKDYFKPEERPSVLEKWKDIPKQLNVTPNFNNWGEFCKLVNYRNGLVHGVASRPQTSPQPADIEKPVPSKTMLDALPAGWAIGVVVTLVERLHDAARTSPPTWLVHP